MADTQARGWVFTWNNFSEDDFARLQAWAVESDADYMVLGREVGAQGTSHIQGYAEWTNARRFSRLHRLWPAVHWEPRRGTAVQAAEYCKKDGSYWEHGSVPMSHQGQRSDLTEFVAAAKTGSSLLELFDTHPRECVKYISAARFLCDAYGSRSRGPCIGYWLWGPSGSGKTKAVFEREPDVFPMMDDKYERFWFDGYKGEEAVLIDEFTGELAFKWLDRLCDPLGRPCRVQVKGGHAWVRATRWYVCSIYPIRNWFHGTDYDQVARRFKEIEVKPGEPVVWPEWFEVLGAAPDFPAAVEINLDE